jgi:hypothetical protein
LGRLSVDGRTGQSGAPPDTLRCASHVTQPLGFDRWSSDMWGHLTVRWCIGQVLFTVWCAFCACSDSARAVRALFMHCSLLQTTVGAVSRCSSCYTGQSGATPDSPVNYSGVAPQKPEAEQFRVDLPGAPDTVRCARPWQPSVVFCSFLLNPFLDFLLVCVEPLAPIELII